MPRRGQGQQAVRTAQGQQYGQAKAQEDAQAVVPLPEMEQPRPATMAPGSMPFAGRSQRPNESVMTPGSPPDMAAAVSPQRRFDAMRALVALEPMASVPGASPHLRNTVRKLKAFVGNVDDFADMNPMSEQA